VVGPVIDGTIVVIDREGERHAAENGSFVPDLIDGVDSDSESDGSAASNAGGPARRPVAIKCGRIRFDARGATAMVVDELELGGHAAVVDGGVDLATGRPLEITARWIDDVLLHVVDATTRAELSDVRVCFGGRFAQPAEHPGLPGPPSVLFEVEHSPVHLTRATSIDRVVMDGAIWIGARDRAWMRETIDFEREREREVALGPAGALKVVVTEPPDVAPFDRRAPPRVRLRRPGRESGEPICDFAAEPGEFELDGLEPGDVVAAVEIGDSQFAPLALSRAEVSIRAGGTARATLSLDPSPAPNPTTLAGTAYVPPAWGRTEMQIDLEATRVRGGMRDDQHLRTAISVKPLDGRLGWHEWSFRRVLPGSYRLLVRQAAFETHVEVGDEGRDDVTLTLQEPALLQVRVLDEETQGDIEVGEFTWAPEDRYSASFAPLEFDRATSRWIAAVLPGIGRIFSSTGGRERAAVRFTVVAGINELVLHSPPACGVLLTIVGKSQEGKSVEITWSSARSPDSYAGFAWIGRSAASRRVVLPEAGHYRFTGKSGADGTAELLFEVDVPRGEFVEKTITLDR
jgi:hypothetical protein